ncbi:hypothetical protein G6F56_004119 [Rhizopus delemar]|nr:hypothetical protein G6F56_004119 [Rhizopus delemar]
MSAIVTRSEWESSKEIRPLSLWKDTITEVTQPCQCGSKDCMYQLLMDPTVFEERPALEKQRFRRKPLSKDEAMRKFLLNELIETEKSYNQLLNLIFTKYMQPMIKDACKSKSLVKTSHIPLLFEHLPELLELSNDLLEKMEANPDQMGTLFLEAQPRFFVFIKYTMHYKFNEKEIRKACKNALFIKIDQENLSRRDTKRLGMFDYFIAPIQRITRYCLLIQDLQKYSNSPNFELDEALKATRALAAAMDSV